MPRDAKQYNKLLNDKTKYHKHYDFTDNNKRDVSGILKKIKTKYKELKLRTYDINLEYQNSHFEFFANGFYNKINNYIYLNPSAITIAGYDVFNYFQTNAKLYGGEFGVHFHPHPLDWLHFESSFETVTGEKQNGEFLPFIPANNWNNSLRAEFNIKNWLKDGFATLNVSNTFDQRKVSGFETSTDGYTLVNLGIGGQVTFWKTHFNININGNNLFNKNYIAHLSRLKNDGIPNMGRNIVLGINFNL